MGYKVIQVRCIDDGYDKFLAADWESCCEQYGLPAGTIEGRHDVYSKTAFKTFSVLVRVWHSSFSEGDGFSAIGESSGAYHRDPNNLTQWLRATGRDPSYVEDKDSESYRSAAAFVAEGGK